MSSSEAPKKAAAHPVAASPRASGSHPTARIDWRCVLEGQDRKHQRGQRDSGDDPEQRPPGVSGGLDAADRWASATAPNTQKPTTIAVQRSFAGG